MILGYHELVERIGELFPCYEPYKIGAASVDVRIGSKVVKESGEIVDIGWSDQHYPVMMMPGEFWLVDMYEEVHVPQDLSCMFLLKSTSARMGLQHMFAGWVDPGWQGVLTLELKNVNLAKPLHLHHGQPIGQLVFMQTVGAGTYKGRYQNSISVSGPRSEVRYDAGS